eukprot:197967-Pleurochrysis_carterae.AAC.1
MPTSGRTFGEFPSEACSSLHLIACMPTSTDTLLTRTPPRPFRQPCIAAPHHGDAARLRPRPPRSADHAARAGASCPDSDRTHANCLHTLPTCPNLNLYFDPTANSNLATTSSLITAIALFCHAGLDSGCVPTL